MQRPGSYVVDLMPVHWEDPSDVRVSFQLVLLSFLSHLYNKFVLEFDRVDLVEHLPSKALHARRKSPSAIKLPLLVQVDLIHEGFKGNLIEEIVMDGGRGALPEVESVEKVFDFHDLFLTNLAVVILDGELGGDCPSFERSAGRGVWKGGLV